MIPILLPLYAAVSKVDWRAQMKGALGDTVTSFTGIVISCELVPQSVVAVTV